MTRVYLGVGQQGPPGVQGFAGPPGVGANWRGVWSGATTYALGDGVTGSNGKNYISLAGSNLNHDPTTDGGVHWSPISLTVPTGWIDVTAAPYNADNTGATDVTAAVNAAIQAAYRSGGTDADGGGTVYFPPGIYKVSTGPISLNDVYGVRLMGAGPAMQHQTGCSVIQFTGTSGHVMTLHSVTNATFNCEISDLRFEYTSASYAGDLIDIDGNGHGDVQNIHIHHCAFHCAASSVTARSFIRISQAVINQIDHCHFDGALNGIRLGDPGGTYVNVQTIEVCTFNSNSNGHIYIGTADGENIVINKCGFEGSYVAIYGATTARDGADCFLYAPIISDSWFGDNSTANYIDGLQSSQNFGTIRGCFFASTSGKHLTLGGSWIVEGCTFQGGSTVFSSVTSNALSYLGTFGNNYNSPTHLFDSTFTNGYPSGGYAASGCKATTATWETSQFNSKVGINGSQGTLGSAPGDGDLILGARAASGFEPGMTSALVYKVNPPNSGVPSLVIQAPVNSIPDGIIQLAAATAVGGTPTALITVGLFAGSFGLAFNGNTPIPPPVATTANIISKLVAYGLLDPSSTDVLPVIENVNAVATSGTAQTIPDVTSDTMNEITLTGNCTFTFPTGAAGKSFLLSLTQDGTGSRTVTWPASVVWSSGTAPTLTTTPNKTDMFSFVWNSQRSKWIGLTAGLNF